MSISSFFVRRSLSLVCSNSSSAIIPDGPLATSVPNALFSCSLSDGPDPFVDCRSTDKLSSISTPLLLDDSDGSFVNCVQSGFERLEWMLRTDCGRGSFSWRDMIRKHAVLKIWSKKLILFNLKRLAGYNFVFRTSFGLCTVSKLVELIRLSVSSKFGRLPYDCDVDDDGLALFRDEWCCWWLLLVDIFGSSFINSETYARGQQMRGSSSKGGRKKKHTKRL